MESEAILARIEIPDRDAIDLTLAAMLLAGKHSAIVTNQLECAVMNGELDSIDDPRWIECTFDGQTYRRERGVVSAVRVTRAAVRKWLKFRDIDLPADNLLRRWLDLKPSKLSE